MKEYTLLAVLSVAVTILADAVLKTRLLKKREFYFFIVFILAFKLLVNGYLTAAGIVRYDPDFFMGFRLGSIPAEDFLFGFSMVTLSIVFWEYFKKDKSSGRS